MHRSPPLSLADTPVEIAKVCAKSIFVCEYLKRSIRSSKPPAPPLLWSSPETTPEVDVGGKLTRSTPNGQVETDDAVSRLSGGAWVRFGSVDTCEKAGVPPQSVRPGPRQMGRPCHSREPSRYSSITMTPNGKDRPYCADHRREQQ